MKTLQVKKDIGRAPCQAEKTSGSSKTDVKYLQNKEADRLISLMSCNHNL